MTSIMRNGEFGIGVHHPKKGTEGRQLAPPAPQDVFEIADYDDGRLPPEWERDGDLRQSFFVGVRRDSEFWFDFRPLNNHSHHIAVVVSVQGLNALSREPIPHGPVQLQQYRTQCPKHGTQLVRERHCPKCGYQIVAQNYVTNAAGHDSIRDFWLDGHRLGQDGKIAQFVFSAAGEGLGIAEQVLGERRARGVGFAIFRSKHPKRLTRTGSRDAAKNYLEAAEAAFEKGLNPLDLLGNEYDTLSADSLREHAHATRGGSLLSANVTTRGAMSPVRPSEVSTMRRIGEPTRVELSAGRHVDQQIHPDPNPLSFWESEPAAYLVLTPTDEAWVQEITRNGPTVQSVAKYGPLAGLKMVGDE